MLESLQKNRFNRRKPRDPNRPGNYDRVPPQAVDAEKSVLGAMLLSREAIGRVLEILDSESFYLDAHRKIYSVAVDLYDRNEPVDILTISEELKKHTSEFSNTSTKEENAPKNWLDEVGGAYYLTELAESVPTAANVEHYARIVLEKALLRQLITVAAEITEDSYRADENVFDIIDRSEQRIFALSERRLRKGFVDLDHVLHDTFEEIGEMQKRDSGVTGVPTGFDQLDEMTSGFQRSDFIIIAGRPSMGKTAFSLNIARNAALDHNVPVGIFSLEMANYQLAMRMLCSEARVNSHLLRTGRLAEDDFTKLGMVVGRLAQAPIYIDDTPGLSLLELRAKARRLRADKGLGMLIIDYLQLIQGPRNSESRQQEISAISRSLKALAKALHIPVVALSQLSRAVESRSGDKRPMLSDLRESGAIEQDADVVIFIYRPERYGEKMDKEGNSLEGVAEIIIGKQRNGPTGTVKLTFLDEYARFENPYFSDIQDFVPDV